MRARALRRWAIVAVVALLSNTAAADVWGVKTHDPGNGSGPPATLFHFDEGGGGFVGVGAITLGGLQIDVDGLAMDAQGVLYGFQVEAAGTRSRLLTINTASAAATVVGAYLDNRDIRGAIVSGDGRLLTLDVNQDQLIEINPLTGAAIGAGIDLMIGAAQHNLTSITDIAQGPDSAFWITGGVTNELYSLDIVNGQTALLHTDTTVQPDGILPALAGLAFSQDSPDPDTLLVYDVNWDDDISAYQTDAGFTRSMMHPDIFPSYNAGRGDLAASPVPEPTTMLLVALAAPFVARRKRR